jgi:hypothetical protein
MRKLALLLAEFGENAQHVRKLEEELKCPLSPL